VAGAAGNGIAAGGCSALEFTFGDGEPRAGSVSREWLVGLEVALSTVLLVMAALLA